VQRFLSREDPEETASPRVVIATLVLVATVGGWGSFAWFSRSATGTAGATAAPADVVTVLAASSLTDVVDALTEAFEAANDDLNVRASFAGSSTLARQIAFGAPADLFLSADRRQADHVVAAGRARGPPASFATNRTVVLVRRDGDLFEVDDLVKGEVRIVVAAPDVPAGAYALAVIAALERQRGSAFADALR